MQPNHFSNGLNIAPSGAFVDIGRSNGANMFATPWRRASVSRFVPPAYTILPNGQVVVTSPSEVAPGVTATPTPVPAQPAGAAEIPMQPEASAVQQLPAIPGPAEQPAPTPSAAVQPTPVEGAKPADDASRYITQFGATTPESVWNGYMPDLSERLTRNARNHGMEVPVVIRVSLVNRIAILHGVVRSAHDRALIAIMAGLEPGIDRVSNRLTVASKETGRHN